jgi:hypothetical protein
MKEIPFEKWPKEDMERATFLHVLLGSPPNL